MVTTPVKGYGFFQLRENTNKDYKTSSHFSYLFVQIRKTFTFSLSFFSPFLISSMISIFHNG